MADLRRVRLGEVAFEYKERIGQQAPDRPVYGVDKSVGLTAEPRYQSNDLSRYKRIENGMFAYNPMRLNIGSIGFCHDTLAPGIVSPDYVVFACRANGLLPRFMDYHIRSTPWADWLSLAGEGSVRERIYFRKLQTYQLILPDISYQAAAVEILSALDEKIELNRRVNETLEALAQAIFKDWFVDFGPVRRKQDGATDAQAILGGLIPDRARAALIAELFPGRFGDDGLPEGWGRAVVSDLIEVNPREPLTRGAIAPYSEMASLPTKGSTASLPISKEYTSGMRFRNGDALLARITPCLENGKAAFVDFLTDDHAIGWGSTEFIVFRAKFPIPEPFTYLLIRHPQFFEAAIRSMTGTSGRQRAQTDILKSYPIPNAGAAIYRNFGVLISPIFAAITARASQNRVLAETHGYLLPKLMFGEVNVRDAEAMAG
ncbi:hypothetical protein [Mesorhizobium sp. M0491]|uniref:restriction endonuclease subunit S n=1 Tax=Mesorhizobium sp. M0491 TaxID=2956950 RepID=UPI00333B45E6